MINKHAHKYKQETTPNTEQKSTKTKKTYKNIPKHTNKNIQNKETIQNRLKKTPNIKNHRNSTKHK